MQIQSKGKHLYQAILEFANHVDAENMSPAKNINRDSSIADYPELENKILILRDRYLFVITDGRMYAVHFRHSRYVPLRDHNRGKKILSNLIIIENHARL